MLSVSTMRPSYSVEAGLLAESFQKAKWASRKRRWIRSSRSPFEKYGRALSEDLGATKTLGWLAPLSTAGQPSSVKRIGLDFATQSVGVADSVPVGRSKWGLLPQF